MSNTEPKSREEIDKAFSSLLRAHRQLAGNFETRAEAAERGRDREVVQQAAGYTVDNIVKGLAELQLEFSKALEDLSDRMETESGKVGQLQRAIEIERRRVAELENLTIAAEALALLEQEHAHKLAELQARSAEDQTELDAAIAETRERWASEAAARDLELAEQTARRDADRKLADEAHAYELARQDKLTANDNALAKRNLERELAEQTASKDKDWSAREAALELRGEEIAKLRTTVAGRDEALAKAETQAREQAIAAVNRDAKHEAELAARDAAADIEVFELKIKTLESRIGDQTGQLQELSTRLSAALSQAQKLASEALKNSREVTRD
ncbi:Myosin heavy chain [Enhygromyxa salina]|uniref:Myosin heavy chain n=1 Tax=Enhygromyxa salina TaxID=215803 RepID=A0A0C2CM88_9BACT|nr:hypothetical protein [Enhygromyxa salina]KIG12366.1 Myosin heavy chain [Enhygromyxa salina]